MRGRRSRRRRCPGAVPGAVPGAACPALRFRAPRSRAPCPARFRARPAAARAGRGADGVAPATAARPGGAAADVDPAAQRRWRNPGRGAPPAPPSTPPPRSGAAAGNPNFASPIAHAAFEAAHKELGVPYLYGGESPKAGV